MRVLAAGVFALAASAAHAESDALQRGAEADASLEEMVQAKVRTIPGTGIKYFIGGFVQLDAAWTRKQLTGDEKDAFLPSAIPFGTADSGTRLGIRASQINGIVQWGEVTALAQADLFAYEEGVKPNVTQLVARYREWVAVGKTYSTFMDDESWPTTLDYNGPSGAVFSRRLVLRGRLPLGAALKLEAALEDPQADEFERPDLVVRLRYGGENVQAQLAGISRSATYQLGGMQRRISGSGISASLALPIGEDRVLAQWSHGEGIAGYFNDGLSGVGAVYNAAGQLEPLEITGWYLYYERKWAARWTSTAGLSELRADSEGLRPATDLRSVRYASANLVHRVTREFFLGGEVLWGRAERINRTSADDVRVQLTARYYLF